jgi:hypothetical protein
MRLRLVLLAWTASLLLASAVPVAHATYDPIDSGLTTLELDKGFLHLLEQHGVELATREGAAVRGRALRFPVSGGKFDPGAKRGTVEHGGTVLFQRGAHSVSLRRLQLKTTRRSSPLVVKVAGGQLKLGVARRITVTRRGFGEEVTVSSLRLTAKVATRLCKRLGLPGVFEQGMPLGSAQTRTTPATVAIGAGNTVQLVLDPAMAAKLNDLHVSVNPIFPAERPSFFTLPIFNGKLALDFSTGFLQLQGGIELIKLGGGQIIWRESRIDLGARTLSAEVEVGPSPPYAGKAGVLAVAAFDLAAGTTALNPESRSLTVSGAALTLPEQTAALFNEAFAKPQGKENAFAAGEILGRISFTASSQ